MDAGTVAISVILALVMATVVLSKAIAVVPVRKAGLVERLGKYRRTLAGGLSIIMPFIDKVRLVDIGQRVVPLSPQSVVTSDNRTVVVELILHLDVTDPVRATYEVDDYMRVLETLTEQALRTAVDKKDLTETLHSRDEFVRVLRGVYHSATYQWGVEINDVVLNEIRQAP